MLLVSFGDANLCSIAKCIWQQFQWSKTRKKNTFIHKINYLIENNIIMYRIFHKLKIAFLCLINNNISFLFPLNSFLNWSKAQVFDELFQFSTLNISFFFIFVLAEYSKWVDELSRFNWMSWRYISITNCFINVDLSKNYHLVLSRLYSLYVYVIWIWK